MRRIDLIIVVMITTSIMLMPAIEPMHCDCDAKAHYQTVVKVKHTWRCIGTFKITAYSYDEGGGENYQTAGGYTPVPYYTTATDPDYIPTGTVYRIEGLGEVQAQDTGGAIHGQIIDYHIGYDSCDSFGVQYRNVYIKENK